MWKQRAGKTSMEGDFIENPYGEDDAVRVQAVRSAARRKFSPEGGRPTQGLTPPRLGWSGSLGNRAVPGAGPNRAPETSGSRYPRYVTHRSWYSRPEIHPRDQELPRLDPILTYRVPHLQQKRLSANR